MDPILFCNHVTGNINTLKHATNQHVEKLKTNIAAFQYLQDFAHLTAQTFTLSERNMPGN